MAAVSNGNSLPVYGRRIWKHIHDNVHGNINLDPLCLKFIDTEEFQRLRELKQLGVAFMVYPGAVHSRFEHSLGVYWLAGEAVHKLISYQGAELGLDKYDIQTVKLAGLLHDVGHGPFSHLFEREFLPRVSNGNHWSHEEMSVKMIDHIIDNHHIDLDTHMAKNVKDMVLASSELGQRNVSQSKAFLYDIVANGRNGIDVDKFDYITRDCRACGIGCNFDFQRFTYSSVFRFEHLTSTCCRVMETMRVIDDEICYRAKEYLTVHKLFATRADLYRTVYTHPKVKAIELMVADALVKADDHLRISSCINDPSEYWKLDDSVIKTIETSSDDELRESRDLILRIRRRELYQFCNEYAVPKDQMHYFKRVTPQDIVCSQMNGGALLREDDVAVANVKIDLTRGTTNPFDSIKFFQDYDSTEKICIPDECISHLLPTSFQDMIVRVYSKRPELVGLVSQAFENFQLKTYGVKKQVHSTPDKKKMRF